MDFTMSSYFPVRNV